MLLTLWKKEFDDYYLSLEITVLETWQDYKTIRTPYIFAEFDQCISIGFGFLIFCGAIGFYKFYE